MSALTNAGPFNLIIIRAVIHDIDAGLVTMHMAQQQAGKLNGSAQGTTMVVCAASRAGWGWFNRRHRGGPTHTTAAAAAGPVGSGKAPAVCCVF